MRERWGKKKKGEAGAALIVLEGPGKGEEFVAVPGQRIVDETPRMPRARR